jgi:hypothetical protein
MEITFANSQSTGTRVKLFANTITPENSTGLTTPDGRSVPTQARLIIKAIASFTEPFTLDELTDKAIDVGLRTNSKSGAGHIVRYYSGMIQKMGLMTASSAAE